MASSAADRLLGAGAAAGEELLLLHQHHPQMYYHVPQHSRREKLRFPPPEESPTSTSLLLHDPSVGTAPPLYTPAANSLAIFPPSSSAAPSAYPHHHGFVAPQFDGRAAVPFPAQHQIQAQTGFSLSLSSASSPRPPAARPHLASRPAPLGPFTGYATVLNRSRFLEPARKLLEEACHAGYHAADSTGREMLLETQPPRAPSSGDHGMEGLGDDDRGAEEDRHVSGVEQQWKKTTLISMLDEVCRRYRQYHQQVQTVITSFECVAGFSTAAPFVSVALKAMTKHFRCLKHIISEQLSEANKNMTSRENSSSFGIVNSRACLHRTADCTDSAFAQPNVWRPQRGLPERAVSVLRAWLFEHFLHPYPTDVDKQNLAKQTGLTRNQVSNWFINARVRLWKPMVEEIHSLEMHQKNKASSAGDKEQQPQQPSSSKKNSVVNPQQFQIDQRRSSKAIQEHIPAPVPNHIQQDPPVQYAYKNMMPSHQHAGAGGGAGIPSAGNSVSLTLGLHQHNGGACFSEPLPINVARRFGLEECGDSYLLGAFGGQERQLIGKDMGSRLFHDFVG